MKKLIMAAFAAVMVFASGGAWAALPSGYVRLEYIQGDGSSTKILTDFTPNPTTDKIVAEVEFPSADKTCTIWCSRGGTTTTKTWTLFRVNTGYLRADYNGLTSGTLADKTVANTKYTLTYDRNAFTWTGGGGYTYTADSTFTAAGGPLMLFASYWNGTGSNNDNYSNHKLYSFKIYRNDALIHDYVPCKDASDNATLCDIVAENPSTLTRTGTFVAGPLVVTDCITVAGSPEEFGSPDPGYGVFEDMVSGESYTFTCPAGYTNDAKTVGAVCTGWKLKQEDCTITTGPERTKTIVYSEAMSRATLTWLWDVEYISIPYTWTGAGADNLASNGANWDKGVAPTRNAKVILDGVAANGNKDMTWDLDVTLASWTQDGYTGTVTFNTTFPTYSTTLTNVVIAGNARLASGTWTHPDNFYTGNDAKYKKDKYRLMMTIGGTLEIATNATTGAFGKIDVHGRGYNYNPGYSSGDRGGSYGGSTSDNPGKCYGSIKNPTQTGSGGNGGGNRPSNGGGAVYIVCAGDITVDGAINADGTAIDIWDGTVGYRKGSGGAVILKAKSSISGAGLVSARAGQGGLSHSSGGGGRMAFYLTDASATHAGFTVPVSVRQSSVNTDAAGGTIYYEVPTDLKRGRLYVESASGAADTSYGTRLIASQQAEITEGFSKITLAKNSIFGVDSGVTLDITNTELVIDPAARLLVWGTITVPATYEWKTFARIDVKEGAASLFGSTLTTLSTWMQFRFGTEITTPGSFTIATGGRLNHSNGSANAVNFNVGGDFTIEKDAWLDVTAYGYAQNYTACGSNYSTSKGYPTSAGNSGSSHGGRGGTDTSDYTTPCVGSVYAPTLHGAAGTKGSPGCVKLTVAGTTTVNGVLSAAGQPGDAFGAAGGSLILTTKYLAGTSDGLITAIGGIGWNYNRPGGGGRIAITLTGCDATMDAYHGDLVAFGRGRDGWDWYRRRPKQDKTTDSNYTIRSGAGSIYVREKNAAQNMGELVYDQFNPYLINTTYAFSELNQNIADRDFGKVLVRNKAIVKVLDDYKLTTSVFSNGCQVTFANATGLILKGDAAGKAYVYGSTDLAGLTIDPGVDTIYFEAGTTNRIRTTFTARGTDEAHRIKLRSTVDGAKFYLDITDAPTTSLDYLDVKDSEVVGGTLAAEHSVANGTVNWSCITIDPGEIIVWNGSASTSWGDAANWQLQDASPAGRIPVRTDRVFINHAGSGRYPMLPLVDVTLSNLTIQAGASLTMSPGYDLTVGDFTCAGTLAAASSETITLAGNVAWTGAFNPMASTVKVVGEGKNVNLGGKSFNVLEFDVATSLAGSFIASTLNVKAGATITFAAGAEAVSTTCYITGESGDAVTLTGSSGYTFTVKGYSEVAYVQVDHADSSDGATIYAANSTDNGNNDNWQFTDNRKVWKGTSSTAFATAANWVGGVVPSASDGVIIAADAQRVMEITTDNVTIDSLTVLSQGVKFSKPVTVTQSVTLLGGTTTVDKKLTVGGSLTVLSGATMTHTAQGKRSTMLYFFDVDCGGDIFIADGAVLTATCKGYNPGYGPGYMANVPGAHGGIGNDRSGNGCAMCYDSIFCPTNCGSGGTQGQEAGGCIVLKAAGKVTVNGTVKANGAESGGCDCNNASGGTVFITAGEIAGTGKVTANGGIASHMTGGGGRLSFILTKPGADFSSFAADVVAEGGRGTSTLGIQGGCGTVYYQKGDEPFGHGTIKLYSKTDQLLAGAGNTSKGIYHGLCGLGYPGMDDLSNATIELGANGGIFLFGDIKVGNVTFADNITATYPTRLNFGKQSYRGNYVIHINQPRPIGWNDAGFKFGELASGNYYNGTRLDNIFWQRGLVFFVR